MYVTLSHALIYIIMLLCLQGSKQSFLVSLERYIKSIFSLISDFSLCLCCGASEFMKSFSFHNEKIREHVKRETLQSLLAHVTIHLMPETTNVA